MATKKTSKANALAGSAASYPEIATDSESGGHELPSRMNTQRLKNFQFGDTLDLALEESHFKAQYDGDDFLGTVCGCRGRAFPWQSLLLCIVINLIVGITGSGIIEGYNPTASFLTPIKFNYLTFIIAFLLVFRGQQAYAYYRKANEEWMKCQWNMWEAYQLMASHVRNPVLVKRAGQHIIAFAICLKACLRGEMQPLGDAERELEGVVEPSDLQRLLKTHPEDRDKDGNVKRSVYVKHGHCSACLYVVRRILEHAKADHMKAAKDAANNGTQMFYNMNGAHVWAMRRLSRLNESLCTMHMISTSPFPWVYMLHLRTLVMFWLCTLPLAIVQTCWKGVPAGGVPDVSQAKFSPFGIIFIVLVFGLFVDYAILGLEDIGNQLQNPFGVDVSDLPMETFCKQIHANLNHTADVVYKIYGASFEAELDILANGELNDPRRGKKKKVSKEGSAEAISNLYQEDSSDCS